MDSTQVQTGEVEAENFSSLPNIIGGNQKFGINLGQPVSEEELVSHIQRLQQSNSYNDGYRGQHKAMNRVGNMVSTNKPV